MYVTTIVQLEPAAVEALAVAFALRDTGDVTVLALQSAGRLELELDGIDLAD